MAGYIVFYPYPRTGFIANLLAVHANGQETAQTVSQYFFQYPNALTQRFEQLDGYGGVLSDFLAEVPLIQRKDLGIFLGHDRGGPLEIIYECHLAEIVAWSKGCQAPFVPFTPSFHDLNQAAHDNEEPPVLVPLPYDFLSCLKAMSPNMVDKPEQSLSRQSRKEWNSSEEINLIRHCSPP
jgi:hypothetical protein